MGVIQDDTISPKLFHLCLGNDVILISQDIGELQNMMGDLKMKLEKIKLTINLSKTTIMTKIEIVAISLGNHVRKM